MTGTQQQPLWYRVAHLRPRLNSRAIIRRQVCQGAVWYFLQNPLTQRYFRFSDTAYRLIGLMDGRTTVEAIWKSACLQLPDQPPTQDEVVDLLHRLSDADVLQLDATPDLSGILERRRKRRHHRWRMQLKNPLAFRFSLWDPDRLLQWMIPLFRPLFGRMGFIVWLLWVGIAFLQAMPLTEEIAQNFSSELIAAHNLPWIAAAFILLKLLHELAHGLTVKARGGEVHECGVIFLAFIPMPFMNANAASGFPERGYRILVSAAGIMSDLAVASLAFWFWLYSEPGAVNAVAYNVMVIGTLSSLLVNGNPLLKFDGYHAFADWIDIPNLGSRSNKYIGYLLQRYLLRITQISSPATSLRESFWFLLYGPAAFCYRMMILVVITLMVAEHYPMVGMAIALWAVVTLMILPLFAPIRFLFATPHLRHRRIGTLSVVLFFVVVIGWGLLAVPAPYSTLAVGVVAPPKHSEIRNGTSGVIESLWVEDGAKVAANQPLFSCQNPFLNTKIALIEGRLSELEARFDVLSAAQDPVEVEILQEEIALAEADLKVAKEEFDQLTVRSPIEGTVLLQQPKDLPGRYLDQGTLVGYVADLHNPTLRVAVSQQEVGLIQEYVKAIEAKVAGHPVPVPITSVVRHTPEAVSELPSAALGSRGGGPFVLHPEDEHGVKTLDKVFEVELRFPQAVSRIGQRVLVRFDHGSKPLLFQWYRTLRQLFLRRFDV